MPPSAETTIWEGSPSQWLNFATFALCLIIAGLVVWASFYFHKPLVAAGAALPAAIALWKWIRVASMRIAVSTERITTQVGVFSRHREDMELYRVKDTTLHEPFFLRLVGRANIQLRSSDRTTPSMTIPGVKGGEALRQQIRANVERLRLARGVREMDMDVET